jgi:hypothetical protein
VGGAGGEGLVSPFCGMHLQDCSEDIYVRERNNKHCDHNDGGRRDGGNNFNNGDI